MKDLLYQDLKVGDLILEEMQKDNWKKVCVIVGFTEKRIIAKSHYKNPNRKDDVVLIKSKYTLKITIEQAEHFIDEDLLFREKQQKEALEIIEIHKKVQEEIAKDFAI